MFLLASVLITKTSSALWEWSAVVSASVSSDMPQTAGQEERVPLQMLHQC